MRTEIAFVGKAPGLYLMLLGGGYHGQRLNKIYRGKLRAYGLSDRLY
jgi:sulfite reductase beta subunit-like hemoprotein